MIYYGRHNISDADIKAVVDVLHSDLITQGPIVPKFEKVIADYCGAKNAVALNSATSALHVACLALDFGRDDWLWTTPNTFVSSANCAVFCGGKVDFVDIDPRTYNMCPEKLHMKLIEAEKNGTLPKIVIPVHFAGQPCDMAEIHLLSEKYGFKIIEDASHAIGASLGAYKIGSCGYSHITVFSFHPVKIITSGEGGMALTNDNRVAERMRRLRSHGVTSEVSLMSTRPNHEIWNYQQIELGYNYRLTDIQAALGLSQFGRLNEFLNLRHQIAKRYDEELGKHAIIIPWQMPGTYSSYHLYPIRIRKDLYKKSQRQVYERLIEKGIAANLHYIPVHRQPYYEKFGFKKGDYPNAELFHEEVISLPIHPGLLSSEQEYVISILKQN